MRGFRFPVAAGGGIVLAILIILLTPAAQMAKSDVGSADIWPMVLASNGEYFLYGGIFFAVFTWGLAKWFPNRKLSRKPSHSGEQIWREVAFSLSSNVLSIATGLWLVLSNEALQANMYRDIHGPGGIIYVVATTFALFLAHDTCFYWSHRALHHPKLFPLFHRVHHDSVEPTPFTTFSFHPVESVIQDLNSLLALVILLVIPWHPASLVAFSLGVTLFNLLGHMGFEIYPRTWHRWPILGWKTTCYHHYMHHQRSGGNYGLYFRFWDRLCGTEFKDYEARQDALFARRFAQPEQTAASVE